MQNLYGTDQRLNLEEIFTNDEIKSLKKSFPTINILIRSSSNNNSINTNKENTNKSQQQILKDNIFIYKTHFYKLILENIKNMFEQNKNNIMIKSLSCLIDDLFSKDNIINKNNSKQKLINDNDNTQKLEKINVNRMKQMSTLSLPEKKANDINNGFLAGNISIEKINKNQRDEQLNLKNHLDYFKKLKSPNNNYKNIYYYNIINSKKIINNNNFKKDQNKSKQKLINHNYIINNEKPLYYINYSMNWQNNLNKSNLTYINHKNTLLNNNYNNYSSSSIQLYNKTDQNKNNKKINNHSVGNGIDNYKKLNNIEYERKNRESFKKYAANKLSKKIKSVKFLVKQIASKKNIIQKNKTPIQIKKVNIFTDSNSKMDNISNNNKSSFMNIDTNLFNNIENQNFNIFDLNKNVGRDNILSIIGYYIFNRFGFYNILNYNKYENWCRKIANGYIRSNPYHTDLHAADITHTCLIYLKVGKVNKICKLSKISKCALFLSCICHDYKHPGVNNNYLKETRNKIAIKYNDISILENMHIAQTFKLINNPSNEYNIFLGLDTNTYKQYRKEMISCVLATDMTFHNEYVDYLKKVCEIKKNKNSNTNSKNDDKKTNEYQNYMNVLIHSADISNPTKPFDIYFHWAKLVVEEFYEQGDKEKKLNLPCFCDRNKVTIYQSQLGFINYIEIPYFSLFVEIFENLHFYMENINSNKQKLIDMQEKEKQKKEKKNGNK